jgi:hypothetical protein
VVQRSAVANFMQASSLYEQVSLGSLYHPVYFESIGFNMVAMGSLAPIPTRSDGCKRPVDWLFAMHGGVADLMQNGLVSKAR